MEDSQKFVGVDVLKEIISVGIFEEGRGEPRFHGNIQNSTVSHSFISDIPYIFM